MTIVSGSAVGIVAGSDAIVLHSSRRTAFIAPKRAVDRVVNIFGSDRKKRSTRKEQVGQAEARARKLLLSISRVRRSAFSLRA